MSKDKTDRNWFARHKILTGFGVLVILGIIATAAGGGDSSTPTASNSSDDSSQAAGSTAATAEKTEYKVAETADINKRQITVTEVQRNYQTGNQFAQPESGKEFVIVTVNIVNNDDKALDYNTYDFKLQDSSGVQQSESFMALSEGKLNSGSLAPGGKVTGKLAYEVPTGDAGLKLLFTNMSIFNNKTITFTL